MVAVLTGGLGFTADPLQASAPAPGSLDTTFNPGTGADAAVRSVAVQSDGKILIGGEFTEYNGTSRSRIARLDADGSLDATFNPGTGANDTVLSVVPLSDGKILIGGNFTTYNGTSRSRIARLNADGTLDTGFLNTGAGASTSVRSVVPLSDGKILIGGNFTTYNGTSRSRIARLNADGSLDTTFNPGTGANGTVFWIAMQADGKILIGGDFTEFNGTSRNRVARLNADGSLDTGFLNTGAGANDTVLSVAVQADGKILIGGDFTEFNGESRNRVARLNADGTLDESFTPGTGADLLVVSVAVQADDKILIGGSFDFYDGRPINRVARLNAAGTLDTTFNPGTGANGTVLSVVPLSDGKILIGGDFTEFNVTSRSGIARLNGDPPPPPTTTSTTVAPDPSTVALQLTLDFGVGDNVRAGTSTVTGSGRGLAAFADLLLVLRSDPEVIGAAVTDASGAADVVGTIPGDTPAGRHSVTLESVDPEGRVVTTTAYFWLDANGTVTAVTPQGPTPVTPRFTG